MIRDDWVAGHQPSPTWSNAAPTDRPRIRVLPNEVAARIAAGEVIDRPAAVVKELVENAIDAGARAIRIAVRDGGLAEIRVADDGCGIPVAELKLACQRHATSKLPSGDLSGVMTLGFRGEALPSIAAVAELTITSAIDGCGIGWLLAVRDGRPAEPEPAPRARGTTVVVGRLFERLPARLAAIERPQSEARQIVEIVRRLALAAPDVRVSLVIDARQVLQTSGTGDLASLLDELYGPGLAEALHRFGPYSVGASRVAGVLAGPELTRPSRSLIHIIVNGRHVQPRGLLASLERAYRPLLPRGRHPLLALVLLVPPDRVDVNVHPAKLDVRLRDERELADVVADALRDFFGRRPRTLQLSPVTEIAAIGRAPAVAEESPAWDDPDAPIVTPALPALRLIGQIHNRLLLLEGEHGLVLVDQHRAHERVLFERLRAAYGPHASEPEPLPEPLVIELRPAQAARFGRRMDELARLGFQWEEFGGRAFLLRAAPHLPGVLPSPHADRIAGIGHPDGLLPSLLALADEDDAGEGEAWRDRLLVSLSCRTAIRRGRPLDHPAMRALVELLGHSGAPAVCPHGSPLLMNLEQEALARQFAWE